MKKGIKILSLLLVAMMLVLATACDSDKPSGGEASGGNEPAPVADNDAGETATIFGYWECDDMLSEGKSIFEGDGENMFGISNEELGEFMALEIREDGIMSLAMGGSEIDDEGNEVFAADGAALPYTAADNKATVDFYGETMTFELVGKNLQMEDKEMGVTYVFAQTAEMPELISKCPEATLYFDFSLEQSEAMSNFMMGNTYFVEDNTVYGVFVQQSDSGSAYHFGKRSWPEFGEGEHPDLEAEDAVSLDADGDLAYIVRDGEWFYYLFMQNDTDSIRRIHADGTGMEILHTSPEGAEFDYLQMNDGRLWFTDENDILCSMAADGSDLKTEWPDEALFYPYFICPGWLIAQVDADNERLYFIHPESHTSIAVTDGRSYQPIIVGQDIFYTSNDPGEDDGYIAKVNVFTGESERSENLIYGSFSFSSDSIFDEPIFYIDSRYNYDNTMKPISEWKNLAGAPLDEHYRAYWYFSGEYGVQVDYDNSGGSWVKTRYLYHDGTGTTFAFLPDK